jgi:hypothetical protein
MTCPYPRSLLSRSSRSWRRTSLAKSSGMLLLASRVGRATTKQKSSRRESCWIGIARSSDDSCLRGRKAFGVMRYIWLHRPSSSQAPWIPHLINSMLQLRTSHTIFEIIIEPKLCIIITSISIQSRLPSSNAYILAQQILSPTDAIDCCKIGYKKKPAGVVAKHAAHRSTPM